MLGELKETRIAQTIDGQGVVQSVVTMLTNEFMHIGAMPMRRIRRKRTLNHVIFLGTNAKENMEEAALMDRIKGISGTFTSKIIFPTSIGVLMLRNSWIGLLIIDYMKQP